MSMIFICYPRELREDMASGRLADDLRQHFGKEQVFRDQESISGGEFWKKAALSAIDRDSAVLILIDSDWVKRKDPHGRGIGDPTYALRIEIEEGLRDGARLIPVLVNGAPMPREDQLPVEIRAFAECSAVRLRASDWRTDLLVICRTLEMIGFRAASSTADSFAKGVGLAFVDRYGRTLIDYWRLRPRKFLPAIAESPDCYLSPMQFLAASLAFAFLLAAVAVTLSLTALESATGTKPLGDPKALAGLVVVYDLAALILGTFCYRIVCAPWPIRSRLPFRPIFDFQCYLVAATVPLGAIGVLVNPVVIDVVARGVAPAWILLVPYAFCTAAGLMAGILYSVPGIAYLCGVSTPRLWAGLLFWNAIAGIALGLVVVLIMIAVLAA